MYIKNFLPKTFLYIKSIKSQERRVHHNYIVDEYMCRHRAPFSELSIDEVEEQDIIIANILKESDI